MPASPLQSLRFLLIQARSMPEMIQQEQECFIERCRIDANQLATVNVVTTPINRSLLGAVDAVLIGGAGEFSARDDHPWTADLHDFIREGTARGMPIFGSCWGHQVIARAFGGDVIYDPDRAELGSGTVELTEAGRHDPIFGAFPTRFRVNMGHHDRVATLPANAVELAYNESQRNQAFRLRDKPVYGTQFHSELDAERERERLVAYREHYLDALPTEEVFNEVVRNLVETTEVDHLMHDFLVQYAPGGAHGTI